MGTGRGIGGGGGKRERERSAGVRGSLKGANEDEGPDSSGSGEDIGNAATWRREVVRTGVETDDIYHGNLHHQPPKTGC